MCGTACAGNSDAHNYYQVILLIFEAFSISAFNYSNKVNDEYRLLKEQSVIHWVYINLLSGMDLCGLVVQFNQSDFRNATVAALTPTMISETDR